MTCSEFSATVPALSRRDAIDEAAQKALNEHAASCEECSLLIERERHVSLRLQQLKTEMHALAAPPAVEAALVEAFRGSHSKSSDPLSRSRRTWRAMRWAIAVAAMALLFAGLFAMRSSRQSSKPMGESPQQPTEATTTTKPSPERPQPAPDRSELAPRQKNRRYHLASSERVAKPSSPATEVTTGFLPVYATLDINDTQDFQLMRVELPGSAMAAFGLPMNIERPPQRVKADVLIGSDGMARAIRFVR